MVDLRGDMNVMAGKAFLEGLYMSGSDDPTNEYKAPISLALKEASPGGNSSYTRTNMYTMLASPDTINVSQCLIGCSGGEMGTDLGNSGRGIWHVAAGYEQPLTKQLKGQVNVGYLAAVNRLKDPVTGQTEDRKGDGMGTEVNARLDYNILKGLDVGLVGSYVWLGDFFSQEPLANRSRIRGRDTPGSTTRTKRSGSVRFTEGPRGKPRGLFIFDRLTSRGGIPYI